MFDEIIDESKENIISTVCDLIKIPSVSNEVNNTSAPFGEECSKALNYMLNLGKNMGFRTKNLDNYCGYIEFGEGSELVGIIGHLDVVPAFADDGWTTPPFSPDIRDGKLFGRGSIDDKGPVIAALYAMKAIMDNTKVSKRVRLILGLNEEKAWKCIEHYKQVEEWPTIGFSPDANFPAIYAEKGIMSIKLKNNFNIINFDILEIDCKQNAINVVPKYCSITLKSNNDINPEIYSETDKIKITHINKHTIKIESFGKSAHAAHPDLGDNAITNLVKYLLNNFEFSTNYLKTLYEIGLFDIESPKFLSENKIVDESGILTSNVAVLDYNENNLFIKINLRVPVNTKLTEITEKYNNLKSLFNTLEVSSFGIQEPLYIEKDSFLVKTLVNIFNKKSEMNEEAIAIGGGTYARAFQNCISYGVTMPGDLDMCHQVDEFVEIDKLVLSSKIYAEAIWKLAQ